MSSIQWYCLFIKVNWVNNGLLGNFNFFKKKFIDTVTDHDTKTASLAVERLNELTKITGEFILRRGSEINIQYLPHKDEFVIFLRMNSLQVKMYEQCVERINLYSDNVLYDLNALRNIANCPGEDAVDCFCSGIL